MSTISRRQGGAPFMLLGGLDWQTVSGAGNTLSGTQKSELFVLHVWFGEFL